MEVLHRILWSPVEGTLDLDWSAIAALPYDEWERVSQPPNLEGWVLKASKLSWTKGDEHFSQPLYTESIARLLRLVAAKCAHSLDLLHKEKLTLERSLSSTRAEEEATKMREELLRREIRKLQEQIDHHESISSEVIQHKATAIDLRDLEHAKEEIAKVTRELDRTRNKNTELRQALHFQSEERIQSSKDDEKFRLEYKHLVARYKRLVEKSEKMSDILQEFTRSDETKRHDEDNEVNRLRQKVRTLQQENFDLVQSRDHAEELCERREAEALRDMTELQQLHRDIIDEERQRFQNVKEELEEKRREAEQLMGESLEDLRKQLKHSEEVINEQRRQLERFTKSGLNLNEEDDTERYNAIVRSTSSLTESGSFQARYIPQSKLGSDYRAVQRLVSDQQQLQQDNDRLSAELQQMEVRAEARDTENNKLHRLLKEYEQGDDGLRRLRGELADSNRSIELLQDENAQLRERLNAMEDSLVFSAALRELCLRMGVTQDEIDRLRPKSTSLLSEVEILREEVTTLKEEVEWLEKERRHWMNKVRLQPLLDTKLRLELGLTSEQLKQLDYLVDQMKSARLIIEEGDENYKEKYFKELQLRRKEMEHFNDFVKQRIEEALRGAFGHVDLSTSADAASALNALRDRVALIAARPTLDETDDTPVNVSHLREQLRSALQLLEQADLTAKDSAASQAALREQLAAVAAERDVLAAERDKYRSAIFEAMGIGGGDTDASTAVMTIGERTTEDIGTAPDECAPLPGLHHALRSAAAVMAARTTEGMRPTGALHSISRVFEEQLRVKDELIASLRGALEASQDEVTRRRAEEAAAGQQIVEAHAQQDDLRNQIEALQEMNEELNGQVAERSRTLDDMQEAIRRIESGDARELLQKIVVLRQREGKLLQRLRRAREAQNAAVKSEQSMRDYVNTTFASLKEALLHTSTGFVLPRSSSSTSVENEVIGDLQQQLGSILQGRLYREDSAYLLQLQQAYAGMEHDEELRFIRADAAAHRARADAAELAAEELRVEMERLRSVASATGPSPPHWEAEAATWRQKCALYMRRCEDREREVVGLEAELTDARERLAVLLRHTHELAATSAETAIPIAAPTETETEGSVAVGTTTPAVIGTGTTRGPLELGSQKVRVLERDVARLKSVNLGLLHHLFDLQADYRGAQIELEAARQELSLVQDAGDTKKVTEFVSAAVKQHAALRRQSEVAQLRAKRIRIQLCASEANLRVAVNEATAHKLSAFRLYRTYVSQMVALVDYVRGLQRGATAALSPHRAALMHRRFLHAVADADRAQARGRELAAQLADAAGTAAMLQQQLDLCRAPDGERDDVLRARLLTALSAARERDARLAELQEDQRYMQQKLGRAEQHAQRLSDELVRLELGATGLAALDDGLLARLEQLRDSVFAKAEAPALVLQPAAGAAPMGLGGDEDAAVAECSRALDRQAELARECESLRTRAEDAALEARKARAAADGAAEELARERDRTQHALRQLEEERRRAGERERRLVAAHEAQAEVAHRAAEHNSQCLRELLQQKDATVQQAQEQLQVERRKFLEYQLEEATRMERLHEHLFKENNAMVERFREAISGAAERGVYEGSHTGLDPAPQESDSAAQQLMFLTRETLRLKSELREARATNILLEGQLNEQIVRASIPIQGGQLYQQQQEQELRIGEGPLVPGVAVAAATGIMSDQNALIDSLRQRIFSLGRELDCCRGERDALEQQLHNARLATVDQSAVLRSTAAAIANGSSGTTLVQELRAQIAVANSELAAARRELDAERQTARRLNDDAGEWRSRLDELHAHLVAQQADVQRARDLAATNAALGEDMQRMREQNERLVAATNMLKTRLVDEAQQRGESARREQHEVALAQRMSAMQVDSMEQMRGLTLRLQGMQRDLQDKLRREEEALRKHEEAQRIAYDLHKQLNEKDREIARLRRLRPAPATAQKEKGTQVLQSTQPTKSPPQPHPQAQQAQPQQSQPQQAQPQQAQQSQAQAQGPSEHMALPPVSSRPHTTQTATCGALLSEIDTRALAQPQIAAIVRREVERAQRDNVHEISTLRALVRRLESDAAETQLQLRGEREACRAVRAQLHAAQRAELPPAPREAQQPPLAAEAHRTTAREAKPTPASPRDDTAQLRRHIERLKRRVVAFDDVSAEAERYKRELSELRSRHGSSGSGGAAVDAAFLASPLDIRAHKRIVLQLESSVEALQRELHMERAHRGSQGPTAVTAVAAAVPAVMPSESRVAMLERELLERSSALLDLRFEREALELRVGRLQRHLDDVMRVDAAQKKSAWSAAQAPRVEALESVVENLKLVVARLQHENADLRARTVSNAKHVELARELRKVREREKQLREHTEQLTRRIAGNASGGSAMSEQMARLQRRLQTAQAIVEQYSAEVIDLRQKLQDREHPQPYEQQRHQQEEWEREEVQEENRRAVRPISDWYEDEDEGTPPPLPVAPGIMRHSA